MAVCLDDLFATGLAHDWAIKGAGVRDGHAQMRATLAAQDCLYSVIKLAHGGQSARVIGAMTDFVPVRDDNGPLIAAMADPNIRILNGGHAIIAYPGGLASIDYVHEAMADPQIRAFLDAVLTREVLPSVPPVPGTHLPDDKALIIDRFSNPMIADTVRRLCLDGSNRQPKFIVPMPLVWLWSPCAPIA